MPVRDLLQGLGGLGLAAAEGLVPEVGAALGAYRDVGAAQAEQAATIRALQSIAPLFRDLGTELGNYLADLAEQDPVAFGGVLGQIKLDDLLDQLGAKRELDREEAQSAALAEAMRGGEDLTLTPFGLMDGDGNVVKSDVGEPRSFQVPGGAFVLGASDLPGFYVDAKGKLKRLPVGSVPFGQQMVQGTPEEHGLAGEKPLPKEVQDFVPHITRMIEIGDQLSDVEQIVADGGGPAVLLTPVGAAAGFTERLASTIEGTIDVFTVGGKRVGSAQEVFDSVFTDPANRGVFDTLRNAGASRLDFNSAVISLARAWAALEGQTERSLSDRDMKDALTQVGAALGSEKAFHRLMARMRRRARSSIDARTSEMKAFLRLRNREDVLADFDSAFGSHLKAADIALQSRLPESETEGPRPGVSYDNPLRWEDLTPEQRQRMLGR